MSVQYPAMVVVALAVGAALVWAYGWLQGQRAGTLAAAGLAAAPARRGGLRRHLPPMLFVAALVLLMLGIARPQATVGVPRAAGTVILAFDVSNSMAAKDVTPSRLAAAQEAAVRFVREQPDTMDIGVVAFSQGALNTHLPSAEHEETVAAINRLRVAGGTSLGHAILASLTAITGKTITIPDPGSGAPLPDLGYWRSATIVLLSDGEDTGGPDALIAAELAAAAGVRIETIGVGTVDGSTIEVDGYQMATALNEELLTEIAATTTGSYHRAENAEAVSAVTRDLDLRTTVHDEMVELTAVAVGFALLFLTAGSLLMIHWFGRIL